jgi:prevent-host-death family protein
MMSDPLEEAILSDEPTVITRNGEKVAVIVPVNLYKRMVAALDAAGPSSGRIGEADDA